MSRHALLAYQSEPLRAWAKGDGCNNYSIDIMTRQIGAALNRLGFVVDAVDWRDDEFQPVREYELFIGMLANFDRLAPEMPDSTRKVYWATRPSRDAELGWIQEREADLLRRKGIQIKTPDTINVLLESENMGWADGVIAVGQNDTILNTLRKHCPSVHGVVNPFVSLPPPCLTGKNFRAARKHFIFLSSWFLVRKGLDLVLEAFAGLEEAHLWVCAPLESEPDFLRAYRRELFHSPNIHPVGWIDMASETFSRLTNQCAFMIYPTAAEGMSGAVVNCMSVGLIPVVTDRAGLEIGDFGVPLENSDPESIRNTVKELMAWPEEKCAIHSQRSLAAARTGFSAKVFGEQFETALQQILAESATERSSPNLALKR